MDRVNTPPARMRTRAAAIVAALKNRKTVDLRLNPRALCAALPKDCDRLRLALDMRPRPHLRVSGLGLHALIERYGVKHKVLVPWHGIVSWSAR